MLWRTDEIRVEPPQPIDEARNGIYYLEGLAAGALPDVLEELRDQLAAIGVELPPEVRPLRFGTWIGGDRDGNPNVTPATTREVLELQAVHGIRLLTGQVEPAAAGPLGQRAALRGLRRAARAARRAAAAAARGASRATGGSTPRSPTGCS